MSGFDDDFGDDSGFSFDDDSDFGSSSDFGGDQDFGFSSNSFNSNDFSLQTDEDEQNDDDGTQLENRANDGELNIKVFMTVICFGIILVLGSLFVDTKVDQYKKHQQQKKYTQSQKVENTQTNTPKVETSKPESSVVDLNTNNSNNQIDIVKNPTTWTAFKVEYMGEPSQYAETVFKVESIDGYLYKNSNNGIDMTKYTVTGSLKNLEGSYMIDVSYDIAIKLKVGTEFRVWVQVLNIGDTKIISDIVTKSPY